MEVLEIGMLICLVRHTEKYIYIRILTSEQ